jgi:Bacterial virulence factor lipase N-terminal
MRLSRRRGPSIPIVVVLLLLVAAPAPAAGVKARFDLSSPSSGPFPSDVFTVADPDQNTGVRVTLPKSPACPVVVPPPPAIFAVPTDCFDVDELNTLDGFNIQPRIRVPFTGAIDPSTVAGNVFFVSLGDTLGGSGGVRVEVNQVVWDVATTTLFAESDQLLDQHTRYALIVTNGVRDASGDPVEAGDFASFRHDLNFGQTESPALKAYRKALLDALAASGVDRNAVVAASVFTTQSATAVLEKIRDQIKGGPPVAATNLGTFARVPGLTVLFNRQVRVSGDSIATTPPLPLDLFDPFGHIGALVFGSYPSPDYETSDKFIPPVATLTGTPIAQAQPTIYFNLFVPAGPAPATGWPVAIFGHGFTDSKQGAPFTVAGSFAAQGIATIAINVVGHGGGAGGSLVVLPYGTPPIPSGGRGIDQNGDGVIDNTEGVNAAFPRTLVGNRDGLRQTVADIMQLVHVLETGGIPNVPLDAGRIYYAGQSFGGIYGTELMAIEPSIHAGVLNVPGGPTIDIARISPVFRGLTTRALASRVPQLLNGPFPVAPPLLGFNENLPLRNQPPVVNTVPGAVAIQEVIDNTEWAQQSGNPVAFAPYVVKSPLAGMPPKAVILQSAKGDVTVPNPTANNILRAGDLADRLTYYRNDLAFAADPASFPKNPHTFLTRVVPLALALDGFAPDVIMVALEAQAQIAAFFASNGTVVIDPDGSAGAFFETPISAAERPLLEHLNFIP